MKTIICLIRHGQTDWNKQRLIQGRLNNPLNDTGRTQVKNVAEILLTNDPNWDLIISSPLDRAIESARIIKATLSIKNEIIINDNVIEREFGRAEGMSIDDEIYARILKDDVEGIETASVLQARAYNALIDMATTYPNQKILVTTHSHFIKGFFSYIDSNYTFLSNLSNASLNYITIEDGKVISYCFNKTYKKD